MQSQMPSDQNLETLLKQYQKSWQEDFEQRSKIWFEQMSHEDRINYIKGVFNNLMTIAQEDPAKGFFEFLAWLRSPDGALAWPYMWKEEYRQTMVRIAYHFMNAAHKILIRQELQTYGK